MKYPLEDIKTLINSSRRWIYFCSWYKEENCRSELERPCVFSQEDIISPDITTIIANGRCGISGEEIQSYLLDKDEKPPPIQMYTSRW